MLWISNKSDLILYSDLVDIFFSLYEDPSNFPDPNERENISEIKARITSGSTLPFTQLLIVNSRDEDIRVMGGAVLEYYPMSQCALLTYIFVHPQKRGEGIGKNIALNTGGLREGICRIENLFGKKANALLFEANNPEFTNRLADSIDPMKRLLFFKKVGAKIIDIPYVQPPLDKNKKPVNYLLLLCFPNLTKMGNELDSNILFDFYNEFCQSLNVSNDFYIKERDFIIQYLIKKHKNYDKIFFTEI